MFRNFTQHIDVAQAAFWIFFLFFLGLVYRLRQNDKREGYPMKASPFSSEPSLGFPLPAEPHIYRLNEGGTTQAPHYYQGGEQHAEPLYQFDGTPLSPVGNPLLAGIGPGSWVKRNPEPMRTEKGDLLLQPMRLLPEWSVGKDDADPRGMRVFDWRWREVGTVADCWLDTGIKIIRLLEVEVASGRVLVPIYHTAINEKKREVRVTSLAVDQFADIPRLANPDVLATWEDERLNAYFAAGYFYRGRLPLRPLVAR